MQCYPLNEIKRMTALNSLASLRVFGGHTYSMSIRELPAKHAKGHEKKNHACSGNELSEQKTKSHKNPKKQIDLFRVL
jgi:hypothetical protein